MFPRALKTWALTHSGEASGGHRGICLHLWWAGHYTAGSIQRSLGYCLPDCFVLDSVCTWFECVSMLVILLNCVTLGMYQPCDDMDCLSDRCKILQVRRPTRPGLLRPAHEAPPPPALPHPRHTPPRPATPRVPYSAPSAMHCLLDPASPCLLSLNWQSSSLFPTGLTHSPS